MKILLFSMNWYVTRVHNINTNTFIYKSHIIQAS